MGVGYIASTHYYIYKVNEMLRIVIHVFGLYNILLILLK